MTSTLPACFAASMLLLVLLWLTVLSEGQIIGSCGAEKSREFDKCSLVPLSFGGANLTFTSTAAEADDYCKNSKAAVTCIKSFAKKCLTSLPRQGANLLAVGMLKNVKKVCKPGREREVLWRKMGCFNKAISEFDTEMSTFSDDYRRVMSLPKQQKITGICCRFLAFQERIIELAKRTCEQSHSDYFARFLKDYSSDVGDLLCSGITTKSESCKKLILPENGSKELEKTMSFIPPLLQILSQL